MNEKCVTNEKNFGKYFLLTLFVISLIFFIGMIKAFILPIILSIVIAILVYPLFKVILRFTRNNRTVSALLCCVIVLFAVLVPIFFISRLVIEQGIGLYQSIVPQVDDIMKRGSSSVMGKFMGSYTGKWFSLHNVSLNWNDVLTKILDSLSVTIPKYINKYSRTTISFIFNLFIIIFSLFYFLRDGNNILVKIKSIIPISEDYKDRIISKFYLMSNAIIKGVLFISLLQSVLATFVLWIFGIETWLIWGTVMLVLSVIPFLGTGSVLIPAGIIQILYGKTWQGVTIIIISIFFISLIDNVLRPRIVGRHAGMHDLLVFLSIIGGIFSFGPSGFIIGPLIAAVFLTILKIYKIEFLCEEDEEIV